MSTRAIFPLTVFKILMSHCRFVLSLARRDTGDKMVKVSLEKKAVSEIVEIY